MNNDFSQFKLVFVATSRSEANIVEKMLLNSDIRIASRQVVSSEALSVIRGNAVLPFEQWGIYVSPEDEPNARELLKSVQGLKDSKKVSETFARKILKPFIWIFLILFSVSILYGFWIMSQEVINSR